MNGCLMCHAKAVGVGVGVRGVSERKVRKQIVTRHSFAGLNDAGLKMSTCALES